MRILLASVVLISVVAILLVFGKPMPVTTEHPSSSTPTISPSLPPPNQSIDIPVGGRTYRVAWLILPDPSTISLIPNFTQKRTARSLIDNNDCSKVINGGFYTKDNQPTGLFVAGGKILRDNIQNSLLNGYIFIDQNNIASIQASPPEASVRLALQTGPILIRGGKMATLAIRDDEFARRVVVGISQKGAVIFLTIYDPENSWNGPKLADTPGVLSGVMERLQLTDALNLDGGSASVFTRGDLSLQELTSVGSFFCIK